MVNLKKLCRQLRYEMVSHITFYLKSIAQPSLRLFDLILSKTCFSSHISFLSCFLRSKVIPNGSKSPFKLNSLSPDMRNYMSRRVTLACSQHSRHLMDSWSVITSTCGILNGILFCQNLPNGVLSVVRNDEASLSLMCQNPLLTSSF